MNNDAMNPRIGRITRVCGATLILGVASTAGAVAQSCDNLVNGGWWSTTHEHSIWALIDRCPANGSDGSGNAPLHYATSFNEYQAVIRLIAKGGNANSKNDNGVTPLHYAAQWSGPGIIDALLEVGADPNARTKNQGFNPLHLVALENGFEGQVKSLLRAGTDVNLQDQDGNTPLHLLLNNTKPTRYMPSRRKAAHALVRAGANVNATNNSGETPLLLLHNWGDADLYALLLRTSSVSNAVANDGSTALHRFLRTKEHERAERQEILALLLERGFDPNYPDHNGNTALHLAAKHGFTETVRTLQQLGADGSVRNKAGKTPFELGKINGYLQGSEELAQLQEAHELAN